MIRFARVYGVAAVSTMFFGGVIAVRSALRVRPGNFEERATARWARSILWAAGVRVDVENPQRLESGRAQIVVSNHQSWFDVFSLAAALPVHCRFVGKKELSRIPFLGQAWEKVGHVAVDRGDRDSAFASLQSVEGQIRGRARSVVMFPEGTRSPTGDLTRFKMGAFVMAIRAQVPVVPVAVVGTRRVMPKDSWTISPGRVTIRVGRPISTAGLALRDRERLSRRAREAIGRLRSSPAAPVRVGGERARDVGAEARVACRPS